MSLSHAHRNIDHEPAKKPGSLGHVSVPDGKSGPWTIDTYVATKDEVLLENLRAIRNGTPELVCPPGSYKRLWHRNRGVVMSNTPMEVRTCLAGFQEASGRVLVSGLGLGMFVEAISAKPEVQSITVVEIDSDVISLVAPTFAADPKIEIVQGSIWEYQKPKGTVYDFHWADIWDQINSNNLEEMGRIKRRRLAKQTLCWSEALVRRDKRRWG